MIAAEEKNIEIANIEQTFSKFKNLQDKNQIHACLFNLVVYAVGERRIQFLKDIVRMIVERFPCRIFFIETPCSSQSSESYLTVYATQERISKGEMFILCDKIEIKSSESYLERIPFIILPHLIPDLPIFLLWGQDPTTDVNVFPYLKPYATRLVFDAQSNHDLQQFCHQILTQKKSYSMEVMDINWALTSGWRRIFAQIFDTEPKIESLTHAKEIRIYYCRKDVQWMHQYEIQSIYLQGWLASKFNWTFKNKETSEEKIRLHYEHSQGNVMIDLIPQHSEELNPGAILNIEVHAANGLYYHMFRPKHASNVRVEISSSEKCELPCSVSLPNLRGFLREIFYQKINENYFKMIETIESIDWS